MELFSVALSGATDQVLASFKRDLFREPMNIAVEIAGEADSLVEMFTIALSSEAGKLVKQVAIGGKK